MRQFLLEIPQKTMDKIRTNIESSLDSPEELSDAEILKEVFILPGPRIEANCLDVRNQVKIRQVLE